MDGDLRSIFRKKLPRFHWTSIETGMTGRGIPDSHYCHAKTPGWIEYKVTKGFAVGMRPEQVAWTLRYVRAGGRVFVAVRRQSMGGPRKGAPVDELWLIRGWAAGDLKQGGLKKLTPAALAGVWDGGPSKWSWPDIEYALLS